jgi:hypothetical protein
VWFERGRPDIQITVSGGFMGSSHRVGPNGDHPVIVSLRPQEVSHLIVELSRAGNLGDGQLGSSLIPLLQQTLWLKQFNNAQAHK